MKQPKMLSRPGRSFLAFAGKTLACAVSYPSIRLLMMMLLLVIGLPRALSQPATDGRVTIAAYNVQWLTDAFDDPYTRDEVVPPKPRDQQEQLAMAIRQMNPDVITFEELENENTLRAFNHELLAAMDYRYVASAITNSDRGQNLGILSRLPIVSITSHRFIDLSMPESRETKTGSPKDHREKQLEIGQGTPEERTNDRAVSGAGQGGGGWRFARDAMQVKLQVTPTQTMELIVVHLKSKADSGNDPKSGKWRLAEAHGIKTLVHRMIQQEPQAMILVAGDFNDLPNSLPIKHLLSPVNDGGLPLLVDLHASMPSDQRITYLKPPYRNVGPVDYLMASPSLARRMIPGSCKVLSDQRLLGGSDHAPVYTTFDFPTHPPHPSPPSPPTSPEISPSAPPNPLPHSPFSR